jgi:hypothetical protein
MSCRRSWQVVRHSSSPNATYQAPQPSYTATHRPANSGPTSPLLSCVKFSNFSIHSAILVSRHHLSSFHSASCGQPYKKTAASGPELANPARAQRSTATVTPCGKFPIPPARLTHIHIDIIGPLQSSAGFQYCLTAVDRFTRWSEVIPIPDITAETEARTLLSGWISRFGCPQTRNASLSHNCSTVWQDCGIQLTRTTPYHPAPNGLVDRLHRSLKTSIMCHADAQWTDAVPLVRLGIRSAYKDELSASAAELVYSEPFRIPGCSHPGTTRYPSCSSSAAALTSYGQHR